ncbi:MAG TPA: 2-C-methyl-D-erythritol 4-phosphate cytidylyltransferase [Acidimicrobiales bacterium]|nr:2-C-methyl-D-erythritol 4-phosphate cytidylyltransferase [Acidimicrobiales bacterium]
MEAWAVVVAAGSGSRFGAPKQFADLAGRPVLEWSLDAARHACTGVVLVLPPDTDGSFTADVAVSGGATRSASVRAGLDAVPESATVIAVHDAARPLAPVALWRAVIDAVDAGADAAIPAAPVTDTVKEVAANGHLVTLDRSRLVAVQTPQAFRADVLRRVHRGAAEATDDAALVEAAGGSVRLVDWPGHNLKITSPLDLVVAAALLENAR